MSKIQDLIDELCPDGVEFKTLGEIAEYSTQKIASSDIKDEQFIGVENLKPNFSGFVSGTKPEKEASLNLFREGDILLGNIRPYLKKMIKAEFLGGASPDVLVLSIVEDFRAHLDSKYLYWVLSSSDFVSYNSKNARGGKMPRGDKKMILKYRIPVPPLEVQREIVRILDSFTLLEAELEAELEARRKQYTFYRNDLIQNFQPNYPTIHTLGSLCSFTYGLTDIAKKAGDYRFIRITDIDESGHLKSDGAMFVDSSQEADKKLLKIGDVVMARTGASYGKSVYIDKQYDAVFASFLIKLSPKSNNLNTKFLWHFMQSIEFWNQANLYVSRGGQPQFNSKAVSKVVINLPPLDEQQRIVDVLDRFDALVNDISSGLPAEIAARRKQYEYYRDQLLTFKELEPASA